VKQFVYVVRPTRLGMVDEPTADEERVVREHFAHLQRLLADGRLHLAGPANDGAESFGIVVFDAEDEEQARATMESDPAVVQGVMSATLHPFRISLEK
jgi:uncharacterized protein YciI